MKILLTNDDGINAVGLSNLYNLLSYFGDTIIVAPEYNQSTKSHSISLNTPLRVKEVEKNKFALTGLPADCVNFAINSKIGRKAFDLVVSGINDGANIGDDINYSGTVAAAREGYLHGVNSIAISIANKKNPKYKDCCLAFEKILKRIYAIKLKSFFLNINYPNIDISEIKGIKMTKQGARAYGQSIVPKKDPRGNEYYWIGGSDLTYNAKPGTDIFAIRNKFISITPLITNYTDIKRLKLKI